MNFNEWIEALTGADSLRTAAKKIDVSPSTLPRQLDRNKLTMETVVALCRAYDRDPVTGLVEVGYLQPWEAENVTIEFALKRASNPQLLAEVDSRMTSEADDLFRAVDNPNVVQFDRSNTIGAGVGPVMEDLTDEPFVADDNEAEPAEGDDDYGDGA